MKTKNLALAYLSYVLSVVAFVLLFVGCENVDHFTKTSKDEPTQVYPLGVCIESYPVVPDTIVKGLTRGYDYKVSQYENGRSRCAVNPDQDGVFCHSKERGDTLYLITTYCPATLKARSELGG